MPAGKSARATRQPSPQGSAKPHRPAPHPAAASQPKHGAPRRTLAYSSFRPEHHLAQPILAVGSPANGAAKTANHQSTVASIPDTLRIPRQVAIGGGSLSGPDGSHS